MAWYHHGMSEKQEKKESKDLKPSKASQGELVRSQSQLGGYLEKAFAHLPEEKQQDLVAKAIEGKLDLEQQAQESNVKLDVSRQEMLDAARHVEFLSSGKYDFQAEYTGQTNSGDWKVSVTKNYTAFVVAVAVVVAFIALLLFGR